MPYSYEEVRKLADELTAEERFQSASALWESMAPPLEAGAEEQAAWDTEIERRVSEIRAGTAVTVSLGTLTRDLDALLKQ